MMKNKHLKTLNEGAFVDMKTIDTLYSAMKKGMMKVAVKGRDSELEQMSVYQEGMIQSLTHWVDILKKIK